MNKTTLSYILLISANVIFGFSFLFSKVALRYADPLQLVALRFMLAFLIMNLILMSGKFSLNLKDKPLGKLILTGAIQPVLYFVCETYGIAMTSASFAGIMLGTLPIVGLIVGVLFMHEKVQLKQILCIALSVGGVYLTTFGGEVVFSMAGVLLLFGAVISAAVYAALSASLASRFTAFERTYVMFAVGMISFTLMALVSNGFRISELFEPLGHIQVVTGLIYLGFCSSVLAFFFINYGLEYVSVSSQTLLSNFTSVVSIAAGVIFLKESFSLYQFFGIVLILISVFAVTMMKNKETA